MDCSTSNITKALRTIANAREICWECPYDAGGVFDCLGIERYGKCIMEKAADVIDETESGIRHEKIAFGHDYTIMKDNKFLYSFNESTGKTVWKFSPREAVLMSKEMAKAFVGKTGGEIVELVIKVYEVKE